MSREIKFRVWDKDRATMEYGGLQLWFDGVGELKDIIGVNYPIVVLMQYTGLKDKNGTEIFEGDVVKAKQQNDSSGFAFNVKDYISQVEWKFDAWFCEHGNFRNTNPIGSLSASNAHLIEVVGNIYQDSHLLEKP